MEYFDNCLGNDASYLDYLIATQNGWNLLGYLASREKYIRAFQALEHKEIISIKIGSIPDRPIFDSSLLNDEDIFILARNLQSKASLKQIHLHRFPSNADRGMCALFESLSSCSLVTLTLTQFELSPIVFESFLNILRQCTSLQELKLMNMGLTDERIERIIEALEHNEELTTLDLDYNHGCTLASALKIADFIKKRKKEMRLELPEVLTVDETKEFFARLGDNTNLISFYDFAVAFTEGTQIISRNYELWRAKIDAEKKSAQKQTEELKSLVEKFEVQNDSDICSLITMPEEILKTILYQIDLKSIIQFRITNKFFNEMLQKSKFWRDYYLTYFAVIPKDVLEITDYTYGLQLLEHEHPTIATPSFWELIFRYSMLLRPISTRGFPCNINREKSLVLEKLYRNFPQMIGTGEGCNGKFENLPPNQYFLTKKSPYSQYWFLVLSSGRAIYHLGFEQDGDNFFNAILLLTEDFSSGWEDRFKYLQYVFEWTTANNAEEFEEKIKPIVDIFLNARLSFKGGPTCRIDHKNDPLFEKILQGVIDNRTKLIESLNSKLIDAAKRSCADLGINFKNVHQLHQKIEKFKNMIEQQQIHSAEYAKLQQRIAPRSNFYSKYRSQHGPFVFSFQKHEFIPYSAQRDLKLPYDSNSKKKRYLNKIHGQVAFITFYRMMINFIVMPILEGLWMNSRKDPDFLHEPHYQTLPLKPLYTKLFADVTLTRFNSVSVRHAHPNNWPITALAVANRIMEPLVLALHAIVSSVLSKSESQIRQKQEQIQQFQHHLNVFNELLSQQHIDAIMQLLQSFID